MAFRVRGHPQESRPPFGFARVRLPRDADVIRHVMQVRYAEPFADLGDYAGRIGHEVFEVHRERLDRVQGKERFKQGVVVGEARCLQDQLLEVEGKVLFPKEVTERFGHALFGHCRQKRRGERNVTDLLSAALPDA